VKESDPPSKISNLVFLQSLIERNALGSLLLGGGMEPVGEEEVQLVFISHKSFLSLFYTWGTSWLALKRRQRE
jgi:hypothetical protein